MPWYYVLWIWLNGHTGILTIFVTIVGLGFIWEQIRAAKKQAEAGKDAADAGKKAAEAAAEQANAAVATLEHMRQNTKPRLVVTPIYHKLNDANGNGVEGIALTVENYSSVMAICYFPTLRKDLDVHSAYDPVRLWRNLDFRTSAPEEEARIRDSCIRANGNMVFFLPFSYQFTSDSVDMNTGVHSSLSLYYGDGEGGYFVSKIHYVWSKKGPDLIVEIIGREHKDIHELPLNPYTSISVGSYSEPEGYELPLDIPPLRVLYMTDMPDRVKQLEIGGVDTTGNIPITIPSYRFDSNGWPILNVQVGNCLSFSLSYRPKKEKTGNFAVANIDSRGNPADFGLHFPVGSEESKRYQLYRHIIEEILRSFSTDIGNEFF